MSACLSFFVDGEINLFGVSVLFLTSSFANSGFGLPPDVMAMTHDDQGDGRYAAADEPRQVLICPQFAFDPFGSSGFRFCSRLTAFAGATGRRSSSPSSKSKSLNSEGRRRSPKRCCHRHLRAVKCGLHAQQTARLSLPRRR